MSDNHAKKRQRIAALIADLQCLSDKLETVDQTPAEGSGMIRAAQLKNIDYKLDEMENSVRHYLSDLK